MKRFLFHPGLVLQYPRMKQRAFHPGYIHLLCRFMTPAPHYLFKENNKGFNSLPNAVSEYSTFGGERRDKPCD